MAQRPLDALLDQVDPMWPLLQQWIAESPRLVEVLPVERREAITALIALQVTTHSTLGALAWETGGILLDHGWLRILGAASDRMQDGLLAWNGVAADSVPNLIPQAFMVSQREVWKLQQDMVRQVNDLPPGTSIRIRFKK